MKLTKKRAEEILKSEYPSFWKYESLDDDAAQVLAASNLSSLDFPYLCSLSDNAAESLSNFKGDLNIHFNSKALIDEHIKIREIPGKHSLSREQISKVCKLIDGSSYGPEGYDNLCLAFELLKSLSPSKKDICKIFTSGRISKFFRSCEILEEKSFRYDNTRRTQLDENISTLLDNIDFSILAQDDWTEGDLYYCLSSINSEQAKKCLSFHDNLPDLELDRLISLSEKSAKILSAFNGYLSFCSLREIDEDTAKILSHHKGSLDLRGLEKISDSVAESLSWHLGEVNLQGLDELSENAAIHLAYNREISHNGNPSWDSQGLPPWWRPKMAQWFKKHVKTLDTAQMDEEFYSVMGSATWRSIGKNHIHGPRKIGRHTRQLEKLSAILGLPAGMISRLCYTPNQKYHNFSIPKRKGGSRTIHKPASDLMLLQKRIKQKILDELPSPQSCVTAFTKGKSILNNAESHTEKSVVVKFDLKDFFPSISFAKVFKIFTSLGFNHAEASDLSFITTTPTVALPYEDFPKGKLVHALKNFDSLPQEKFKNFRRRGLPQGAPTSPQLANLAALRMDQRMTGLAKSLGFSYTRYADDLTFSSESSNAKVNILIKAVSDIVGESGFILNHKKTGIMRAPGLRRVTGLIVDGNKPKVRRSMMRKIRALIHQFDKLPNFKGINQLQGYLSFVQMINTEQFDKLTSSSPDLIQRIKAQCA